MPLQSNWGGIFFDYKAEYSGTPIKKLNIKPGFRFLFFFWTSVEI